MSVAKKSYILTLDGVAAFDDGKQSGAILVGKGGTIDDAVALQHGIEVYAPGEYEALMLDQEAKNVRDLEAARKAPFGASLAAAPVSGQVADKAAVDGAKQTVEAAANKTSPVAPVPAVSQ